MAKSLKITIEGPTKSGKTTIALLIQKVLANHNIYSEYTDPDVGRPTHYSHIDDDDVRVKLKSLSDQQNITVDIVEKR